MAARRRKPDECTHHSSLISHPSSVLSLWVTLLLGLAAGSVHAQQTRGYGPWYQPLDQYAPPGRAANWTAFQGKATPGWQQPVRFALPTSGTVTLFEGHPEHPVPLAAPAVARLIVGHVYRFRISALPEFPGVELYPSVEVLDRLHPPAGSEDDFPIPVPIEEEEIERVLAGGLVTKVIYVEQPQAANTRHSGLVLPTTTIPAHHNALAAADQRGRPLLILRLGGRLPATGSADSDFWGSGAPFEIVESPTESPVPPVIPPDTDTGRDR